MILKEGDRNINNRTYNFLTLCPNMKGRTIIPWANHNFNSFPPRLCHIPPAVLTPLKICLAARTIIKYADDTVLIEFLSEYQKMSNLQDEVTKPKHWCDDNSRFIDKPTTKEVNVCNKRRNLAPIPITSGGRRIEQVDEYKYLRTINNKKQKFDANIDNSIRRAEKRLFTIKLAKLHVKPITILLTYKTFLENLLLYDLPAINGHLSAENSGITIA